MVLSFLAQKLAARGGVSKGFLVTTLGILITANIG